MGDSKQQLAFPKHTNLMTIIYKYIYELVDESERVEPLQVGVTAHGPLGY